MREGGEAVEGEGLVEEFIEEAESACVCGEGRRGMDGVS